MTQDELWIARWQDAVDFLETYHRKPSKFPKEGVQNATILLPILLGRTDYYFMIIILW